MSRQSALQFIRDYYCRPAYRGGRVMVEHPLQWPRMATIINGKRFSGKRAKMRVKFDGATRTSLIDPSFAVKYIGE